MAPVQLDPAAIDLAPFIAPGDGLLWGQHCSEPVPLVDAALALAAEVDGLSAFLGLGWRNLADAIPESLRIVSYGWLGRLAGLERLKVVPCHYSSLPRLFAERQLPGDVALIQVAPPDADGRCSLGVGAEYVADALVRSRVIIAEVNDQCPASRGAGVDYDALTAVVATSRPLLEAPSTAPGAVETAIAQNVAGIVQDGDTLQLGVGALPGAILSALAGHRDLGVHSGMISDGVLDLIEAGVITNARKPHDPGVSVTGAALGSMRLFRAMAQRDDIRLAATSETHAPAALARIGPLAAINSGMQVDLTGQVGAERVGDRRMGAIGGQVDFLRGAALSGGHGIIALPARRIVAALDGPVTTARSDVDWVVTEHGARQLGALSEDDRRAAMRFLAGAERVAELDG